MKTLFFLLMVGFCLPASADLLILPEREENPAAFQTMKREEVPAEDPVRTMDVPREMTDSAPKPIQTMGINEESPKQQKIETPKNEKALPNPKEGHPDKKAPSKKKGKGVPPEKLNNRKK